MEYEDAILSKKMLGIFFVSCLTLILIDISSVIRPEVQARPARHQAMFDPRLNHVPLKVTQPSASPL